MRKWKVVALLLVLGAIVCPFAAAQSDDDLRTEVELLKREMQKLRADNARVLEENANLRTRSATTAVDTSLEERINALTESLEFAATAVDSGADVITASGDFRIRNGWVIDRDFGGADGGAANEDDEGSFTDARFELGFGYDLERDVTAYLSIQANGEYDNGNVPDGGGNLSNIDLYEGYIVFRNVFGRKEFSSKIGRQELVFGNEFQFGDNDYFSGETFDGSRWTWDTADWSLDALVFKLATNARFSTINHPYTSGNGFDDDELYSLYFTLKTIQDHELDLYWIYFNGHNGASAGTSGSLTVPGNSFYYHTFGARIGGVLNVAAGLDWNLEAAYQTGEINQPGASDDIDVDAFAIEAELGITFSSTSNFRLYARFLYAEGPNNGDAGYIPLFGERHANADAGKHHGGYRARYGVMDIIPLTNIITPQIGLHFDPARDWTLGLTVLYAVYDEDNAIGAPKDELGFEVDLWGEYRYSSQTTLSGGVGLFFPEDGAPTPNGFFAGSNNDVAVLIYMQARVVF